MTTHALERERFMAKMEAEGMPRAVSAKILRHAQTIQRLSEAECNGDWPCDNGERKVEPCSRCEAGYVRSSMIRDRQRCDTDDCARPRHHDSCSHCGMRECGKDPLICPNCRAQDLIREWCSKATHVCAGCNGNTYVGRIGVDEQRCSMCLGKGLREYVPVFQGDPRGSCVKIRVPSGRTDDNAREGICVPTR